MGFCLRTAAAAAIAFGIGAAPSAHAQTPLPHRHPIAHRRLVSRGDDVVVPTGRSYLDPGPGAAVGTEDRYFYDTAHSGFHGDGPDFTRDTAGFELLPRPRDPPGQTEPLFVFDTPGYVKGGR